MADLELIRFRPEPAQYAWTFGGAAPVSRIQPPAVLEVYTEDCFAGRVRSEQDLVSQVCEFPYLNPQTGPFYIEGAEPGDTVAVHFVSIEPARTVAASTTVPLFGALTGTHLTALLQEPLPEVVWLWQLDAAAGIGHTHHVGRFNGLALAVKRAHLGCLVPVSRDRSGRHGGLDRG